MWTCGRISYWPVRNAFSMLIGLGSATDEYPPQRHVQTSLKLFSGLNSWHEDGGYQSAVFRFRSRSSAQSLRGLAVVRSLVDQSKCRDYIDSSNVPETRGSKFVHRHWPGPNQKTLRWHGDCSNRTHAPTPLPKWRKHPRPLQTAKWPNRPPWSRSEETFLPGSPAIGPPRRTRAPESY